MDHREAENLVSKLTPEQKIQLLRLIEILKAIEEGSVDND